MNNFQPGMLLKAFALFCLIYMFQACEYDNLNVQPATPENCDTTLLKYNDGIKALVATHCGTSDNACHKTGAQQVNLDIYDEINDAADNGDLMGSLRHEPGFEPMPSGGIILDECTLSKFQKWVDADEPEN